MIETYILQFNLIPLGPTDKQSSCTMDYVAPLSLTDGWTITPQVSLINSP